MESKHAISFLFTAMSFAKDVDCLLQHRGVDSFNVSSTTDDGTDIHKVNITCTEFTEHPATGPMGTVHFALGHAIELLLKAILIEHGQSSSDVRKFGHDLKKAANAVQSLGVNVPDRPLIDSFSDVHKNLTYRYPEKARLTMHDPDALRETVRKLIAIVRPNSR